VKRSVIKITLIQKY